MFAQHAKCQQNIFCHVVMGFGYDGANFNPFYSAALHSALDTFDMLYHIVP